MQLVAYGAQDIYLTGNPQITFFKVVYRRHTNFSMEVIEQTINGSSTLTGSPTSGTVTISRNGDLVHKVYVTSSTASIENGMALVNEVELEIGGQKIDKHYQEWNEIWNELSTPDSKALALRAMTGSVGSSGGNEVQKSGVGMVQVPLNFWFCRNPGLALPLIALQYHEVKLKFTFGTSATSSVGVAADVKVMVDYIYLDTEERRRFAQQSHEYLIEQLQKQSDTGAAGAMKLNFNHPVKELIWTSDQSYTDVRLVLNGHDRFAKQEEEYFQLRQPMDHHTAVPTQNLPTDQRVCALNQVSASFTELIVASTGAVGEPRDTGTVNNEVSTGKVRVMGIDGSVLASGDEAGKTAILFNVSDDTVHKCSTASLVAGDLVIVRVKGSKGTTGGNNEVAARVISSTVGNSQANTINGVTSSAFIDSYILVLDTHIVNSTDGDITTNLTILSIKKLNSVGNRTSQLTDKINVYSFALKPEEHQPSGTCNFSRIDTAKLHFEGDPHSGTMNTYAVNYNVLRIMSGMGGLAYSN